MNTIYRTYVEGTLHYEGDSLEDAARTWDRETYSLGRSVPGGVAVATYSGEVQVRDGWIMHVHDDGTTYLSPTVR